jgi:Uma2 family endonuclease
MLSSVLAGPDEASASLELLRPEPLASGGEPEERVIICGISWDRYLAFDQALGEDRPGPRLYYREGELEIMTTSNEHERIKKWIGGFLEIYFEHLGMEVTPRGQATMRSALKRAGAEPDEAWCLNEEKEFPDLVLEVALTSGGVDKLDIYRRFDVREVWFWRKEKLEIFALNQAGRYEGISHSGLLPALDLALLDRCAAIRSWQKARQAFRAALAAEHSSESA